MDFALAEDEKMIQTMARDFAVKEVEPIAAHMDETDEFPAECTKKMQELGLFGVSLPEEYGGDGGGSMHSVLVTEEIAKVCGSLSMIHLATITPANIILAVGDEEQKRRFVPGLIKDKMGAFSITEAGAGSDTGSLQTTATRKGDGYVLNGTKLFVTNGEKADTIVVYATLSRELGRRGITSFAIEKGMPGFNFVRNEKKLGLHGCPTSELSFEDCYVPMTNRLGAEKKGLSLAIQAIETIRINISTFGLGIAEGAFEHAVSYAKEREQFGHPIADFEAIQWRLADMATLIDCSKLLIYRCAYMRDQKIPFGKEVSMAKVFASETAIKVTYNALQIYGGYGYIREYPLERFSRDARVATIFDGTSDIQRMVVSRYILR